MGETVEDKAMQTSHQNANTELREEQFTQNYVEARVSNYGCKQTKESSLQELLEQWGMVELTPYLSEQKVTVDVLKVIKRHHIENMFQTIPIGFKILFEHNLENWRNEIGHLLEDTQEELNPQNLSENDQTASKSTSYQQPYPTLTTSDAGAGVQLDDILNCPKGRLLCSVYEKKNNKFEEEQRNTLIHMIVQYFDDRQLNMSLGTSHRLESEIIAKFETEKLEYYRTKKRGRLYNKYSNQKSKNLDKSLICQTIPKTTSRLKINLGNILSLPLLRILKSVLLEKLKEVTTKLIFSVPEANAETCFNQLSCDTLGPEEFDHVWTACAKYRLNDIKAMATTAEFLKKWSFYRRPLGWHLVHIDYNIAFGNGDQFFSRWKKSFSSILQFLRRDGHIKDKTVKSLLDHIMSETDISDSKNGNNAALLWAIHGYLTPTGKFRQKNSSGKLVHGKYTIKDSQESFIYVAKTEQEVVDRLNLLKEKHSTHPLIICKGEDIFNLSNIIVWFDDVKYNFTNIVLAVDVCFKIMYLFNLPFPAESKSVWNFIETAFFKHEVQLENGRVKLLSEAVIE